MVHSVNVPRRVDVEEYYVLRGISDNGMCKSVVSEKEFENHPTLSDIAGFLESNSRIDFVSVSTNYRIDGTALPFR